MKTLTRVKKNSAGFIRLIIVIIIILIVASFLGLSPQHMWNEYLGPIFSFIWDVIVAIVSFLVKLIKAGVAAFDNLLNIIN